MDVSTPEREPRLLGSNRSALVPPLSLARWLVILILLACVYFFHGFLAPVLAALIIGFASWPIYRRVLGGVGGNRTLAASIMIAVIVLFILVPILMALSYATNEARQLISWIMATNANGAAAPSWFATLPLVGEWATEQWDLYVGAPGALGQYVTVIGGANVYNIYQTILATGGTIFDLALNLLFMLIALLFVYRDGASLSAQLDKFGERILPVRWQRLSRVVPATISSTVTGMTIIAIGEGIVLGIAYWLAGAPSPVLLGVITGVAAMIPGGAPLSFTLVSIYLVASGSIVEGLALFVWGSVELFIVDKTLRPKLVGGPIKLPFLPTFFGLIGGVKTMGFVGLFVGPVLMALLVSMWREWVRDLEQSAADGEGGGIAVPAAPQPVSGQPSREQAQKEHA
ncbi:AI-2E family transporter [Pelagibacterium sp. 26DY04]|nr:AI-2E family transporter [Pelagibacterium sp. 26DY04]WMT88894.1 AI-2E family transporter [Pelagibacterium sp. 26DY04]